MILGHYLLNYIERLVVKVADLVFGPIQIVDRRSPQIVMVRPHPLLGLLLNRDIIASP